MARIRLLRARSVILFLAHKCKKTLTSCMEQQKDQEEQTEIRKVKKKNKNSKDNHASSKSSLNSTRNTDIALCVRQSRFSLKPSEHTPEHIESLLSASLISVNASDTNYWSIITDDPTVVSSLEISDRDIAVIAKKHHLLTTIRRHPEMTSRIFLRDDVLPLTGSSVKDIEPKREIVTRRSDYSLNDFASISSELETNECDEKAKCRISNDKMLEPLTLDNRPSKNSKRYEPRILKEIRKSETKAESRTSKHNTFEMKSFEDRQRRYHKQRFEPHVLKDTSDSDEKTNSRLFGYKMLKTQTYNDTQSTCRYKQSYEPRILEDTPPETIALETKPPSSKIPLQRYSYTQLDPSRLKKSDV